MKTLPKERRYETLSYLPPLTDAQIAKQLQYILDQGYIPGVEFNETSAAEMRYWTLWKLPLFGARTSKKSWLKFKLAVKKILAATSASWVLTT